MHDQKPPQRAPQGSSEHKKIRKKRPRKSIKLDRVDPRDFSRYNLIYSCDQCSHFDSGKRSCTMGFWAQHTQERQLALYNRTGFMAFCRFLEID
jgi:hypothetical protein